MIVLKFGGTSVEDARSIERLGGIAQTRRHQTAPALVRVDSAGVCRRLAYFDVGRDAIDYVD